MTNLNAAGKHRVWRLGADVDTDVLAPGAYMKLGIEGIAPHCLEALRPEFARDVCPGDVIAAGPGFGIGSSREQAAGALRHLGVAAVIAPSYSGLFFRNAYNLGLLLLTCPEAETLAEGEAVRLDLQAVGAPAVLAADGRRLAGAPIPDYQQAEVNAGGLFPLLRERIPSKTLETS